MEDLTDLSLFPKFRRPNQSIVEVGKFVESRRHICFQI